jgi:hypothetical protein
MVNHQDLVDEASKIAVEKPELDRANEQWNSRTIGTKQRRKIMSINDKEYKRKCLQGILASTLTTAQCGCCCFLDGFYRGSSRRKNRCGMGKCVYLVVNASLTLLIYVFASLDEDHE